MRREADARCLPLSYLYFLRQTIIAAMLSRRRASRAGRRARATGHTIRDDGRTHFPALTTYYVRHSLYVRKRPAILFTTQILF